MKDHNPHDPVNIIGEAYELLLEKTMHDLHVSDGTASTEPSKFSYPVIPSYAQTQKSHWIENKKYLLKNSVLEYLRHAGDKTTITLRQLNHSQNTPDKPDENETNMGKTWCRHKTINTAMFSANNNAPQYKKCNNKAFRRMQ